MNRCLLLISLLFLAAPLHAAAQPSSELDIMREGAQLYQDERFEAALDLYKEALSRHGASGPLFYNMGNVYLRTGHVGQAIRHYEKAARLMPRHRRVQHNLDIARSRVEQPIPSMPVPFWQRWWNHLMSFLGPRGLLLIGLGAYIPAVGLISYRIWNGKLPEPLKRSMWTLIAIAAVGIGSGLLASWYQSIDRRAVVIAPDAKLYRDPADNSTVNREIPEGTILSINEDLSDWQNVQLPNGATGWIEKGNTGDI